MMMLSMLKDPLFAEPPTPALETCSHAENVIPEYPVVATHHVTLDEETVFAVGIQLLVYKWIKGLETPAIVMTKLEL